MHDIDRALFEVQAEEEEFGENESYETSQEVALATELLEVSSEDELDRFLGNVLSSAVSAARSFANSDAGRAVGGVLKSAARQALPQLGGALGGLISPGAGALGAKAGQWLSGRFELGLETEGLSAEDREYQTARSFVRFATETAQRAAQAGRGTPPQVAAQQAAVAAAQRHLPGLLRPHNGSPRAEGRWVRRGNRIVIFDA